MKSIAERIKEGLEMRDMKQTDLARISGIGKSSISTYISGEYEPKQRNIYKIAKALNVDEGWLMGNDVSPERIEHMTVLEDSPEELTTREKEVLRRYRSLDDRGKETVDFILQSEADRCDAINDLRAELNAKDNALSENNPDSKVVQFDGFKNRIIHYFQKISAGDGELIVDDLTPEKISIPDISEYRNVDYAVKVKGISMQPRYNDGDMLLVQSTSAIDVGQIGIFNVDGKAYVKKLGESELISLNPECENIPLAEGARCMGIVISKLP